MEAVITALTTGVTSAVMFKTVAEVMPFVIVMIPFALGLLLLRKLIRGAGKGKATI
ncbi:hypothetical protein [Erysipelothrix aquatica]|uniref:hypothetical protein n=1 Tax=Erysipelothrix aquatica TaxID=2683714 RepID=UPI001358573B|nr:hypothetical protein [Erysipelothrix aquatica]